MSARERATAEERARKRAERKEHRARKSDPKVINEVQAILNATAPEFEAAEAGSSDYQVAQVELSKKMAGVSAESAHRGSLLAYIGELMARTLAGQEVIAQRIVQGDAQGQGEAHYRAGAAFASGDASVPLADLATRNARVNQLLAMAHELVSGVKMPARKADLLHEPRFVERDRFSGLPLEDLSSFLFSSEGGAPPFFLYELFNAIGSFAIFAFWSEMSVIPKVGFTAANVIVHLLMLSPILPQLARNAVVPAKNVGIALLNLAIGARWLASLAALRMRNAQNARHENRQFQESQANLWQVFAECLNNAVETDGSSKEAMALRKLVKSIQKGMVEKASALACDMELGGTQLAEIASAATQYGLTGVRVTGDATQEGRAPTPTPEQELEINPPKVNETGKN